VTLFNSVDGLADKEMFSEMELLSDERKTGKVKSVVVDCADAS
jgi:hypothetical protein